jgi:hypothetical protein
MTNPLWPSVHPRSQRTSSAEADAATLLRRCRALDISMTGAVDAIFYRPNNHMEKQRHV